MTIDVERDRQLAEILGVKLRVQADGKSVDPDSEAALLCACRILLSDQDAWMFFPQITPPDVEMVKTAAMRAMQPRPLPLGIPLHPKW